MVFADALIFLDNFADPIFFATLSSFYLLEILPVGTKIGLSDPYSLSSIISPPLGIELSMVFAGASVFLDNFADPIFLTTLSSFPLLEIREILSAGTKVGLSDPYS